jgi:hypothetical protein
VGARSAQGAVRTRGEGVANSCAKTALGTVASQSVEAVAACWELRRVVRSQTSMTMPQILETKKVKYASRASHLTI